MVQARCTARSAHYELSIDFCIAVWAIGARLRSNSTPHFWLVSVARSGNRKARDEVRRMMTTPFYTACGHELEVHMASHSMSRFEMLRQTPQSRQQHAAVPLKSSSLRQNLAPQKPRQCCLRQIRHKGHRRRRLGIHSQVKHWL